MAGNAEQSVTFDVFPRKSHYGCPVKPKVRVSQFVSLGLSWSGVLPTITLKSNTERRQPEVDRVPADLILELIVDTETDQNLLYKSFYVCPVAKAFLSDQTHKFSSTLLPTICGRAGLGAVSCSSGTLSAAPLYPKRSPTKDTHASDFAATGVALFRAECSMATVSRDEPFTTSSTRFLGSECCTVRPANICVASGRAVHSSCRRIWSHIENFSARGIVADDSRTVGILMAHHWSNLLGASRRANSTRRRHIFPIHCSSAGHAPIRKTVDYAAPLIRPAIRAALRRGTGSR